jgi:hypothetical protein
VLEPNDPPKTYNEKSWNTQSAGIIEKEGRMATGGHKYRASKTLAERGSLLQFSNILCFG